MIVIAINAKYNLNKRLPFSVHFVGKTEVYLFSSRKKLCSFSPIDQSSDDLGFVYTSPSPLLQSQLEASLCR